MIKKGGIILKSIIIKKKKIQYKELLRKELKRLAICECMAIPNFWFVYMAWSMVFIEINQDFVHTSIIIYPLTLLSFILLQGSIYWYICLKRIDGKKVSKKVPYTYSRLKIINLFLIVIYIPIFFTFKVSINYSIIGIFIYIFSILEYINYFFIRLSYKNSRHFFKNLKIGKFPKSQIVKEIERAKIKNKYKL